MKKLVLIPVIACVCLVLVSCTGIRKADPEDAAADFIDSWQEEDFSSMHAVLSDDIKKDYAKQDFNDRLEKIYQNIDAGNLTIEAKELSKKELKAAHNNKKIDIPIHIKFDTIAGTVDFNKKMPLHLSKDQKETKWVVDWDDGFILPGLENEGKVAVEKIEPRRGEILDRNKMPLALNDVAYEIGVTPEEFENEDGEKQRLSELLNMSVEKIDKQLNAAWVEPDYYVPLSVIPAHAVDKFNELKQIPSVSYKETMGRTYPLGKAAAHLTGYVGKITQEELKEHSDESYTDNDFIGKAGLEKMYEKKLHGKPGYQVTVQSQSDAGAGEKEVIAEKPVQNGDHVELSIDVNIQEKVYEAYGDRAGTSAVLQPKTGEVLALISSPGYDPDELTYGITDNRWNELMDDAKKPFTNRFRASYAPGSSIKPITGAVGLANGSIKFGEGVEINGLKWTKEGWGGRAVTRVSTSVQPVTLEDALKRSDNIYFAMKAVDMGEEKFVKGMKAFGFEEEIPMEFPIQTSQISNSDKLDDEFLLANTSYGQGEIEMSSLHVALAYTAFLNDGDMLKPSFLLNDKKSEVWKKDLITEKQADTLKEYLRKVVSEGTAKSANDDDLPISGKTGTAELKLSLDTQGHQNGWFVGYPTDDEDILIAMMMEHVEDVGSSSYVAGKVKDILKQIKQ